MTGPNATAGSHTGSASAANTRSARIRAEAGPTPERSSAASFR
jgi:hypothetical protein